VNLHWLEPLTKRTGPFAVVVMDATRDSPDGRAEVELRWRKHRASLTEAGAPSDVLDQMEALVLDPASSPDDSGLSGHGTAVGRAGQVVVADAAGIALNVTLSEPPLRETGSWGPVPSLLPLVRGTARLLDYLLVDVTSGDAVLRRVGLLQQPDESHVTGEDDVLHKVPGGGWGHLRMQRRVEDSVVRNAKQFAEVVAGELRRNPPGLLLVSGEDKVVHELMAHLPPKAAAAVVRLTKRGAAQEEEISDLVDEELWRRRAEVVDRFRAAEGRQSGAVQGLGDVVTALQAGQVDQLLLEDDPSSDLTLWSGGRPEQLGLTREDVLAIGAQSAEQVRADAAIVWALVGTNAAIELTHPGEVDLTDGIGATLRWADESTPRDQARSMPGHGE
jgi:Bacterial archaeo-eukaryotic release factor family 2